MHWVDIGVNLPNARLKIEPMMARAATAGVKQIILTGTNVTQSRQAADLASDYPGRLFSTAGVHPHSAKDVTVDYLETIRHLAASSQVVAIGECGLDFNRNFSPPEQQIQIFEQQLELASELNLPVFLHERDAFSQQYALLEKYRSQLTGGVVHCFTGDVTQMQAYLELGLYIGVTGWVCDHQRGHALRDAVRSLPLERLLLETDAPYLRPKTLGENKIKGVNQNEPCYLPHIGEQLSELMQVQLSDIQRHSANNSQQLFRLT
ncbi:MAG: TatD DNase family protein [Paraglaciecola sp.]|jgi:TatD DNase family protein